MVIGLLSFFLIPRTPASSRFLTQKEKEAINAALKEGWTPDSEEEAFSWRHAIAAFTTPHVSLCDYIVVSLKLPRYSLTFPGSHDVCHVLPLRQYDL